ncbi:peptidase domain-containing ABC transporter [Parabacteroides timonensis]|uniref:peptidase domain-containing ABC transporter n=1 Tax=Parabacteroides timonensis TaxID=1871013 RepID=UPI00094E691B|nr:peptidase domain-containing ABC transporter [Parabacteroides timonensis]
MKCNSLIKQFPLYSQLDYADCGPTCLRMIAKYYGRNYSMQYLRDLTYITNGGVSMLGISDAAENIGFRTLGARITIEQLREDVALPCILYWNQRHFVVCYGINNRKYYIADPAGKRLIYNEDELERCWFSTVVEGKDVGAVLLLEPRSDFFEKEKEKSTNQGFLFFFRYLSAFRKNLFQLLLSMLSGSILQLILPFLTQSLVDTGIRDGNQNFIVLILVAQLVIFVARLSVDFIRSWILLHVNTRINILLISDFLAKLMRLPLHFFDTKVVGDIMQRIGDHKRIETFMTGSSISTLFSFVNFVVFGFVLAYYDLTILGLFLLGNGLYVAWILVFMKYRRELDIKRFAQAAGEQSNLFQLITGMQEIKLNNCETEKRWQWERIQVKLFKISIKGLALEQYQQLGSVFFNQTTNILISFLAARAVVSGDMTLGMMVSLTYIVGQLTAPIEQFIGFARSFQDAKISLERLGEIHQREDEEQTLALKATTLPNNRTLQIEDLSFSYDGADRDYVLDKINLTIPHHKVTAIVGASGSGKTTLIKLLLGFYDPNKGSIKVGDQLLKNINPHVWRAHTGCVMQDGFIFSDSIAKNIAVGAEVIDKERLLHAVTVANIRDFIDSLPLGYNTKIGMEGSGVSQGQRQRILIARAVYKNPEFIFLDEATNALDANNEKEIMEHLHQFYQGRTVVVVAHRLSTVKDADNIVVLDKGQVVEEGTHEELTAKRGIYYKLVKNQLELGA